MNDLLMQNFIQLISANTGLHIREKDRDDLRKKIYTRMQALKISSTEQYYQLLNSVEKSHDSEWQQLLILLTTGETYFFRDRGQLTVLRNRIIPELVEHKKAQFLANKAKPSLRIWSAGCSTGEEAYSLAILVKELIPDWQQWDIFILGTDINPESVAKAKQGFYDSWSFRLIDPVVKNQYFSQQKQGWKINEQIRSIVTFHPGNLLKDCFPNKTANIYDMDIIVCRNVFIYFDFTAITSVLQKFYTTLRPQGYLITGHTELHGQNLGQFQAKVFPETIVYQRSEENLNLDNSANTKSIAFKQAVSVQRSLTTDTLSKSNSFLNSTPNKNLTLATQTSKQVKQHSQIDTVFIQAEALYHRGEYANAIQIAKQLIEQDSNYFEAYYLIAQAFADLGDYEQAVYFCHQGIKVDELSVKHYYLLAYIATEQGHVEQAKNLFKKIIYLTPKSTTAYIEIGCIYEQEGDKNRAKKMFTTAIDLLKELQDSATIEHSNGMTVGELIIQVNKLLTAVKA